MVCSGCGCTRFIPAPAGNTTGAQDGSGNRPVHPRARGEHGFGGSLATGVSGSSPRPRGTRFRGVTRNGGLRFIPAPAGNTSTRRGHGKMSAVHPRARGEHVVIGKADFSDRGSSPRPRGTPQNPPGYPYRCRFIPAPAGNTMPILLQRVANSVHPRARGEHPPGLDEPFVGSGSSPRPRGTRTRGGPWLGSCRFIPAPAGNTVSRRVDRFRPPVHPRARGEHEQERDEAKGSGGSSPRLRGTRPQRPGNDRGHRFIPAPAGNTRRRWSTAYCNSVHPRACGEHLLPDATLAMPVGSSPRPRGTPHRHRAEARRLRFIPAPAGNTR